MIDFGVTSALFYKQLNRNNEKENQLPEHYARVLYTSILREMNEIRDAMNFSGLGSQAK